MQRPAVLELFYFLFPELRCSMNETHCLLSIQPNILPSNHFPTIIITILVCTPILNIQIGGNVDWFSR